MPWMQAFRALPAVKMSDCGGDDVVKIRTVDFKGKRYFYAVNTDAQSRCVTFDFPQGTVDLVTGTPVHGPTALSLAAYELRSFAK